VSDVGVLPLKCFDTIVGQDWLEASSPMWVHWSKKVMKFTHQGNIITLQDMRNDVSHCPNISAEKLKGLLNKKAITHCVQLIDDSV
jgi:hypothetical protein